MVTLERSCDVLVRQIDKPTDKVFWLLVEEGDVVFIHLHPGPQLAVEDGMEHSVPLSIPLPVHDPDFFAKDGR